MNATTMSVGSLICDLNEKGIKLSINQGKLKVDAPKGKVTSNVLGVLRERKPEIIRELEGIDEEFQFGRMAPLYKGAKLPNRIHLEEAVHLYRERGWVQIYSGYLEESIYLVRDESVRVPYPSKPRYTQAELEALKELSFDELKTLHEAKAVFKGVLITRKEKKNAFQKRLTGGGSFRYGL